MTEATDWSLMKNSAYMSCLNKMNKAGFKFTLTSNKPIERKLSKTERLHGVKPAKVISI